MARLTVDGAELYYETLGPEDGPPVVLLHGGPGIGDGRKPRRAFEPLVEEHRLVVPDHRGCGRSAVVPPFTNERFARDLEALRRHLDLGEVVLLGGSYGGFVALEYATRWPEHLAAMVLRDTAASGEYDRRARETARERLAALRERDIEVPTITPAELDRVMDGEVRSDEEFERIFHGMLPLYAPDLEAFDVEAARERVAELTFRHETHNQVFSEVFPEMDYTDALPEVTVPTLVTVGRKDWITPVEASEELADLLPEARLRVFEDSGHNPHLDQPEAYLRSVRSFLDDVGI